MTTEPTTTEVLKDGETVEEELVEPAQPTVPSKEAPAPASEQADSGDVNDAVERMEEESAQTEEILETLEPKVKDKRWVIGKTPENGGNEQTYGVFHQRPLGTIPMLRFGAIVLRAIKIAIKDGRSMDFGPLNAALSPDAGSLQERARMIMNTDLTDVGNITTILLALGEQVPDMVLDIGVMALQVPVGNQDWFKDVVSMPKDHDNEQYGWDLEDLEAMLGTFIDQNYEEIHRFGVRLPKTLQAEWQTKQKARTSRSESSKP